MHSSSNKGVLLRKIFKKLQQQIDAGFKQIQLIYFDEQKRQAALLLHGPIDTAYEGFGFRIGIIYEAQFPFKPPRIQFLDKIWNPYVDFQTGLICCDILDKEWSPALVAPTVIPLSLISLIGQTSVNDAGINLKATQEIKSSYPNFFNKARKLAEEYCCVKKDIYKQMQEKPIFTEPPRSSMTYGYMYKKQPQWDSYEVDEIKLRMAKMRSLYPSKQ